MKITIERLLSKDKDIERLYSIHVQKSVARYVSISENYFDYVTGTEGVYYYKIIADGVLVGGIHCEMDGELLYLGICIDEKHRRLGMAEAALRQLFSLLPDNLKKIEVSIEETNKPSLALFEKIGFVRTNKEDELITYCYVLH